MTVEEVGKNHVLWELYWRALHESIKLHENNVWRNYSSYKDHLNSSNTVHLQLPYFVKPEQVAS